MRRFMFCLALAVGLATVAGCCCCGGSSGCDWGNWGGCGFSGGQPAPMACPQ
ncbi:MAG: hypothetical protein JW818_12685 [Pirellulales bacterium]|nr:hypothetical protein [Pirellulales bacterium]